MKRSILVSLIVLAAVTVSAVVLLSLAEAKKTPGVKDIIGAYDWSGVWVRDVDTGPQAIAHCSDYGTSDFDGAGIAHIVSMERCSDDGELNEHDACYHYTVEADDSVVVWEPAFDCAANPLSSFLAGTHCLVEDNGKRLLCDGTLREDEMLSFHLVGVRQ